MISFLEVLLSGCLEVICLFCILNGGVFMYFWMVLLVKMMVLLRGGVDLDILSFGLRFGCCWNRCGLGDGFVGFGDDVGRCGV